MILGQRLPFTLMLGALLLAGLLGPGCAARSPNVTQFYTLEPLSAPQPEISRPLAPTTPPLSVEVAALRLPQYLERPQIVTRGEGNRLYLSEFNQWGGNLQKDLMRTMALNFSLLLATPNIAITPYHPPIPAAYRVEVEVMRFEQEETGGVTLLAQWHLMKRDQREPLATRITTLTGTPSPAAEKYAGTVATMSRLWGSLTTLIAEAIRQDAQGR